MAETADPTALARARFFAQPTTRGEFAAVIERVQAHVDQHAGTPNFDTASRIGNDLVTLINDVLAMAPEELDEGDLPLVRGAAEYFVLDEDFLDDADVAGFTDDASVVSTVRGYLGI